MSEMLHKETEQFYIWPSMVRLLVITEPPKMDMLPFLSQIAGMPHRSQLLTE